MSDWFEETKEVWCHFTSKMLGDRDGFRLLMSGFAQDKPETIAMYNSLMSDIMNAENIKKTAAITRAMILGFHTYADYLDQKNALSQKTKDALEAFDFEIEDIIEKKNQKYIKRLYERGNVEKAQQVAERCNLDFNQVVSSYTLPVDKKEKSPKVREWLQEYFSDKKDDIAISRIKADIIEDGIIDPHEWGLVKSIASTDGYSGDGRKRGFWSK